MKIKLPQIIIGVLLAAVTILTVALINERQTTPEIELFDPTPYLDTIRQSYKEAEHWRQKTEYWNDEAMRYKAERDGLAVKNQRIIEYYENQYRYNQTADVDQLDSVIRANW